MEDSTSENLERKLFAVAPLAKPSADTSAVDLKESATPETTRTDTQGVGDG